MLSLNGSACNAGDAGDAGSGSCKGTQDPPWVGRIPWKRAWQPTPVFFPGKSHGQRSLLGYGCGVAQSIITEATEYACMPKGPITCFPLWIPNSCIYWSNFPLEISPILYKIYFGGSEVKASASNVGDLGLIPGSGRSPGEGNGNPLQYSCLENPMDGEAW